MFFAHVSRMKLKHIADLQFDNLFRRIHGRLSRNLFARVRQKQRIHCRISACIASWTTLASFLCPTILLGTSWAGQAIFDRGGTDHGLVRSFRAVFEVVCSRYTKCAASTRITCRVALGWLVRTGRTWQTILR